MKKVLFFLESLAGGGAEKVLTDIVGNLDKNKYDITVYTITDEDTYQVQIKKHCRYISFLKRADYRRGGFSLLWYRMKLKLIAKLPAFMVYRWLIKDKYDIEVAFIEGYATKLISASPNKKSKKLAWVHIDMNKNPYADKCYKDFKAHANTYSKYDSIACVSRSVKNVFNEKFPTVKNVIVQYNPVDSVDIRDKANEEIDLIPNDTIQLGTIGRLEPQKGYIRLIEQLGRLKKNGYDFSLWIIGEGSQRRAIERLISEYELDNNIKLIGFQTNPYKYMSRCDAFICSSYAEGFSTAATEAMILGKPVFTTDCAGMKELFGNELCGEIVPNTDEALYDMLEKILSEEWTPRYYTEAVKMRAADFDIRKQIKEIESLLDLR